MKEWHEYESDRQDELFWAMRDVEEEVEVVVVRPRRGRPPRENIGAMMRRPREDPNFGRARKSGLKGNKGGWTTLGRVRPPHPGTRERRDDLLASVAPSQHVLLALFGHAFQGRQEEALAVVKLRNLKPEEQALKDEVVAWANQFTAYGARKQLAAFFDVSEKTITRWREQKGVAGNPVIASMSRC